jgi:predicted PurR-regulated permease PerM
MSNPTRYILLAFALGIALFLAYILRHPLLLIYISIVFAVVLSPAVDRVQQIRIRNWSPGRGFAILIIISGTLVAVTLFGLFALPPIIQDLRDLASQMPKQLSRFNAWLDRTPYSGQLNLQNLEQYLGRIVGGITGLITNIVNATVAVATVIILTAYLILEGRSLFRWAMSMFGYETRERLSGALSAGAERMVRWLYGQVLLMLILGSASFIVFGLIGLRYFYVLAVFAGVANIIPMVGPVVTVIVAGIVALVDSLGKFIAVLVFYLAYQQVESAFLTPRIMKSQVKLSASAVLVALLLGAELAGIAGALVAVPTAALISGLIDEYLGRKK